MYAVIRIRGEVGTTKELKYALKLLRLHKVNHLVLVAENKQNKNTLKKWGDYLTYGEIDEPALGKLIGKRARLSGNKRIDEKFLKEKGFKNLNDLAREIISGKKRLQDLGIKPVFRLTPPKKGYERAGIKKSYHVGGALGYRAAGINKLILKMI